MADAISGATMRIGVPGATKRMGLPGNAKNIQNRRPGLGPGPRTPDLGTANNPALQTSPYSTTRCSALSSSRNTVHSSIGFAPRER